MTKYKTRIKIDKDVSGDIIYCPEYEGNILGFTVWCPIPGAEWEFLTQKQAQEAIDDFLADDPNEYPKYIKYP